MCTWGMHPLTVSPLDPPVHVAIIRWVALIIVVSRLIMVVSRGVKCRQVRKFGPQFTPSPVRRSAVHILPPATPDLLVRRQVC